MAYDRLTDSSSAAELARLIRSRTMSPVEVTRTALERIAARNPSLNAFVEVDADAIVRAQALEDRLMAGDDLPPLAGVPVAMSELFNSYPGWRASLGGVPALQDLRAPSKSVFPRRLEAAGAIMVGSTNASSLGFLSVTDNRLFGPTRNPFDLSRNSGGAAGGAAAAVADGLVPIAGANDGGGWLRTPAAWCGVFAFQSSHGKVARPTRPSAFEVSPFAFDGAITRTVEDGALVLNALVGYEAEDPFSVPDDTDWTTALQMELQGQVVGFAPDFGGFPIDPDVAAALENAVRAFADLGVHVEPISLDLPVPPAELAQVWRRLVGARMSGALAGLAKRGIDLQRDFPDQLPDAVWESVEEARQMTVLQVSRDQQLRTTAFDALQRVLSKVDILAGPTTSTTATLNAPKGATLGPSSVNGQCVDPVIGWSQGFLTNFAGHPSASVPAGLTPEGLPVGLQLIGQRHGDFELLGLCAGFERARPWTHHFHQVETAAAHSPRR